MIHCHRVWCAAPKFSLVRSVKTESLPRITVPHQMMKKIEKIKIKKTQADRRQRRNYKGPLIISCHRQEYNHYQGQTYTNFQTRHLASGGWKHRKSVGDYFTINSFQSNPALHLDTEADSFRDLGLCDKIISVLDEMAWTTPTNIQAKAIPKLLEGKSIICAAETGSGKTLAYLLPILEHLNWNKPEDGLKTNSPHSVILAPSRELAEQIFCVSQKFSTHLDFKPHLVIGGQGTQKVLGSRPQSFHDMLVTTPGVFSKLLTNHIYDMSRLHHIVLDEADTLLDDSFSEMTLRIIRKMRVVTENVAVIGDQVEFIGTQLSFVSATMPRGLSQILKSIISEDAVEQVTTSSLHRLMPHVPQKFMRLKSEDKPPALVEIVKQQRNKNKNIMVFCNKSDTACFIAHTLRENGLTNVLMHADMPQVVRQGKFDEFQEGMAHILVCTDIASRGLDTINTECVINYDFPTFMSDYIHRVGRVGRVGGKSAGHVYSFVTHKWDVDLLWNIETASRRPNELHNVNANIKRKLVGHAERKQLSEQYEAKSSISLRH